MHPIGEYERWDGVNEGVWWEANDGVVAVTDGTKKDTADNTNSRVVATSSRMTLHRRPHQAADRMPNAWHGAQTKDQQANEAHGEATNAALRKNNPASCKVELGKDTLWWKVAVQEGGGEKKKQMEWVYQVQL